MDLIRIVGIVIGVAGASPPFLAFGWHAWERLRAMYVPQEDVDRLAADCIVHMGDGAMRFVLRDLDRARRRGETGEYWLLVRVKEALERMEASGSQIQQ